MREKTKIGTQEEKLCVYNIITFVVQNNSALGFIKISVNQNEKSLLKLRCFCGSVVNGKLY